MNDFGVTAIALKPGQVFENRLLRIPAYQRGYAWQRQQWDEFLEDLELLPEGRVHYTGTVVIHSVPGGVVKDKRGKQYRVFDIVDGQQRLTTIVLLLDAIRRELLEVNLHDLADGIRETYIAVLDRNGQPLPKLTLNEDTHSYFFDHVLHDKPCLDGNRMRSHRNLSDAKTHFAAYLQDQRTKRGHDYATWLETLHDKTCNQLSLTVYAVNEESDAGVIFEVMNNRGKPITELEKVKNYLLYLASKLNLDSTHDLAKRVNGAWTHIFHRLMSSGLGSEDNEDQLLRVHWLMAYDPAEKNWGGSKSLKQKFHLRNYEGRHDELLQDLSTYVDGLRDAATAFCDAANPRHPDAFSDLRGEPSLRIRVIRAAEKLPRLRVLAPFFPLLIAVRVKHPQAGQFYLAALDACERYAFRVYRLLQRRSNAGRSTLILTGHALYVGRYTMEQALGVLRMLTLQFSPNYDFQQALDLNAGRDWYHWVGLKYFLYEYESHLADARQRDMAIQWAHLEADEAKKQTVEHILPQTPKDPYWHERFTDDQKARYTHDIGNLCLTVDNSSYGNKKFPLKRGAAGAGTRCYAEGFLVMERDLAAYTDWDEQSLLDRRNRIVDWAVSRWGVTFLQPAPVLDVSEEDETEDRDLGVHVDPVESKEPRVDTLSC